MAGFGDFPLQRFQPLGGAPDVREISAALSHQPGHRSLVAGDDNLLALQDPVEEFAKFCFRLKGGYSRHGVGF